MSLLLLLLLMVTCCEGKRLVYLLLILVSTLASSSYSLILLMILIILVLLLPIEGLVSSVLHMWWWQLIVLDVLHVQDLLWLLRWTHYCLILLRIHLLLTLEILIVSRNSHLWNEIIHKISTLLVTSSTVRVNLLIGVLILASVAISTWILLLIIVCIVLLGILMLLLLLLTTALKWLVLL